jgi:aminopeptidase N
VPDAPSAWELERRSFLDISSYELVFTFGDDGDTFWSRTEIRFRCRQTGAATFADLQAADIRRAVLNGADLDLAASYRPGRLELPRLAAENTLVVDAAFSYTQTSAGLHRVAGPDGSTCIYSKAYPGGAPRMYCCFDQADLRAPFTVSVNAPAGWSCLANGPVTSRPVDGASGLWKFAATPPIAPYLSSIYAGPYPGVAFTARQGQPPVTASALPPGDALLQTAVSPDLFWQPLQYYQHALGAPYPYGKCDFAFVPGFPTLAFGAPGLVTVREQVLTDQTGKPDLYLATVVAHELAHAWFGGLVDICHPDGTWLIEPLTTYISRTALEQTRPGAAPWAARVSQALPDHAYADNAATIKQLERLIGRPAVLKGLRELMHRHPHGCATKDDLVGCWSRASGRDLGGWAADTLIPVAPTKSQDKQALLPPAGPQAQGWARKCKNIQVVMSTVVLQRYRVTVALPRPAGDDALVPSGVQVLGEAAAAAVAPKT